MTQISNALVRNPRGGFLLALPNREIHIGFVSAGRYVRDDDGKQLCQDGSYTGNTLIYYDDEHLALGCRARLYKTMRGYERAKACLFARDPWEYD